MPERAATIVTNTTPLLSLIAATGDLALLSSLYARVIVPWEVAEEIRAGGVNGFGRAEFDQAGLEVRQQPVAINTWLRNSLDRGEASVIQTALDERLPLVCIDETVGRRVARLNGLTLTGSMGILLKAWENGYPVDIPASLDRMRAQGIWLSDTVIRFALDYIRRPGS
jgi:predicted nucleic acid-binding protein